MFFYLGTAMATIKNFSLMSFYFRRFAHPNEGVLKNKDEAIDKQHERDVNIPLQVGTLLKVKVQFKKERLNI